MDLENIGEQMSKTMGTSRWSQHFERLKETVKRDPDVISFVKEHQEELTPEIIEKSYAKLYEFVQEKEKFKRQDPTMIAPGYEPKLFMNFRFIDVSYVPTQTLLAKQEVQKVESRMQLENMPKGIRNARMDQFDLTEERAGALKAAMLFIKHYSQHPDKFQPGLYLQGSFGVGKTYLLGAIARELAELGFSTYLMHFPTFAVEMKASIKDDTTSAKINQVKQAPILMLDDIGADSMSSWIRDDVLGVILQYRMQEQLPTFFSSNFSMQQLEEEHLRITQRGEDEPLKARRIMERIRYLSKEVEMVGRNRRQENN